MDWHSIQGMRQICHLPATAISGLKISPFNFTFLAAKGWFAIEETNWRHAGYRPQRQDELTYLASGYSTRDLQALGWRLELIWSLTDVHISFQHLVIKRTTQFKHICSLYHHSRVSLAPVLLYFSKTQLLGSSSLQGCEILSLFTRYHPQGLLLTVTHWSTDSKELPACRISKQNKQKIQTAASG